MKGNASICSGMCIALSDDVIINAYSGMDTPNSEQPPYNGQTAHPLPILSIHFYLRRRDNL